MEKILLQLEWCYYYLLVCIKVFEGKKQRDCSHSRGIWFPSGNATVNTFALQCHPLFPSPSSRKSAFCVKRRRDQVPLMVVCHTVLSDDFKLNCELESCWIRWGHMPPSLFFFFIYNGYEPSGHMFLIGSLGCIHDHHTVI